MARKSRQCNHGKGGDWFYSEGKMEWKKKEMMYATQKDRYV